MVNSLNFISDTIKFLRNTLLTNITDPISSKRGTAKFVMTSYPQRKVKYPIITIRSEGPSRIQAGGMRSELEWMNIPVEVRIWARNEIERDELTQQVLNHLRTNQYGASGTSSDVEELHDYELISTTPVDELGQEGIKSMVLRINYKFMLGQ